MYYIVSEDITKFNVEGQKVAIINSLGAKENINSKGLMYKSICKALKKDSGLLEKEVEERGKNLNYGSVFITSSYGLPAQYIIHAITPFRNNDTGHLNKLKNAYLSILNLALKNGIQSILLSTIGTGANGYEDSEVFSLVKEVGSYFAEQHPEIDVYVNVYFIEMEGKTRKSSFNKPISEMNLNCYEEAIKFEAPLSIIFDSRDPNFSSRHVSLEDLSDEIKVDEDIVALLDRYILKNFASTGTDYEKRRIVSDHWKQIDNDIGSKSGRLREYWGRNYGKKTKEGLTWHVPRKGELIRAASTLKMTQGDTFFLLHFCGYYLSEYSTEGRAYIECVKCVEDEKDGPTNMLKIFISMTGKSLI